MLGCAALPAAWSRPAAATETHVGGKLGCALVCELAAGGQNATSEQHLEQCIAISVKLEIGVVDCLGGSLDNLLGVGQALRGILHYRHYCIGKAVGIDGHNDVPLPCLDSDATANQKALHAPVSNTPLTAPMQLHAPRSPQFSREGWLLASLICTALVKTCTHAARVSAQVDRARPSAAATPVRHLITKQVFRKQAGPFRLAGLLVREGGEQQQVGGRVS